MRANRILLGLAAVIVVALLDWNLPGQKSETPAKPKLAVSIKPQHVADALHAIITSHREVYAQIVENQKDKALPPPCEMLRRDSEAVASKGVEYAYVLRSLHPINKRNAPETAIEIKGLESITKKPGAPFYTEELLGGRWYLTAVYPDVAVNQACVNCHSARQNGRKQDYKVGDVLGGLVIRIALEL